MRARGLGRRPGMADGLAFRLLHMPAVYRAYLALGAGRGGVIPPRLLGVARSAGWIAGIQAVNFLVPLAAVPFILRGLGVEGFSRYAVLMACAAVFVIFADFSFNVTGPLRARAAGAEGRLGALLVDSLVLKAGLMLPASVVFLLVAGGGAGGGARARLCARPGADAALARLQPRAAPGVRAALGGEPAGLARGGGLRARRAISCGCWRCRWRRRRSRWPGRSSSSGRRGRQGSACGGRRGSSPRISGSSGRSWRRREGGS